MPGKAQHLRNYPTTWVVVAKISLVVVVKIVVVSDKFCTEIVNVVSEKN